MAHCILGQEAKKMSLRTKIHPPKATAHDSYQRSAGRGDREWWQRRRRKRERDRKREREDSHALTSRHPHTISQPTPTHTLSHIRCIHIGAPVL